MGKTEIKLANVWLLSNSGIEVIATAPIALHLMEPDECGGQSTQILPTSGLDTHYILQSWGNCSTNTNLTTTVSITASKNQTEVTICLSAENNMAKLIWVDNVTYTAGETFHAMLDSLQNLVLDCQCEVFRIDINGSAPVAVFYVQNDGLPRQVLPVIRWGKHYILCSMSQTSDTLQITGLYVENAH